VSYNCTQDSIVAEWCIDPHTLRNVLNGISPFYAGAGNSTESSAAGLEDCLPHFPEEYMQGGRGAQNNPMSHHSGKARVAGRWSCQNVSRSLALFPSVTVAVSVAVSGSVFESVHVCMFVSVHASLCRVWILHGCVRNLQEQHMNRRKNGCAGEDASHPLSREERTHCPHFQLDTGS